MRRILGVNFFIGSLDAAVERALPDTLPAPGSRLPAPSPTLVVAPSAPGLAVDLVRSPAY